MGDIRGKSEDVAGRLRDGCEVQFFAKDVGASVVGKLGKRGVEVVLSGDAPRALKCAPLPVLPPGEAESFAADLEQVRKLTNTPTAIKW